MTLKEMLDAVLLDSGLGTEASYAGSGRNEAERLVVIANRALGMLRTAYDWQGLTKVYTFSLSDDTEYALPADFQKLVPDTAYVLNGIETVDMDTEHGLWGYLQSGAGAAGPRYRFRIYGDAIQVFDPQDGETVRFEYISDNAVRSAADAAKKEFTADTDSCVLDDDLLIREITWRFQRLLGLPMWQDVRAEAQAQLRRTMGRDSGAKSFRGGDYENTTEPYTPLWVNNA